MISLGVLLVILGVGSLVLPNLGLQFRLMDFVDPYQPWAGIIVAAVGLITVLFGAQRRGRAAAVATAQPAPASPASASAQSSSSEPSSSPPQTDSSSAASASPERSWPTEPPERRDEA